MLYEVITQEYIYCRACNCTYISFTKQQERMGQNMIKDITLGQYISGNSLIHRADPRVKIVILFILMISVFFAKAFFVV